MRLMGMTFNGSAGLISRLIIALSIGVTIILCTNTAIAKSAHKLTPVETTICSKLRQCFDILDRHSPDEFDYDVLQKAIFKLGPAGKTALFQRLSGNNEHHVIRAQRILAKGGQPYSPEEQARIAALWPRGDLAAHTELMQANLSPAVISRAIETLSHKNSDIRAQSRIIIDATDKLRPVPVLSQTDFDRLTRAALLAPSPSMVSLINNTPSQTSAPILKRILRSSDRPSVIAAYDALFTHDAKSAFETLVSTLYDLKNSEAETALSLAALLRHRHKDRLDGFYLSFASDIAKDPKMSVMGRLVGFDAVMGYQNGSAKTSTLQTQTDRLINSPLMLENLKIALNNYEALPLAYAENFYSTAKNNPAPWVNIMWSKLKSDPYKHSETTKAFFHHLTNLPTPVTQEIISQAFNDQKDFGLLTLAIKTAAIQKDESRLPQLKKLSTHPISDVRVHSNLAIAALTNGTQLEEHKIKSALERENASAPLCRKVPTDFTQDAKQLPFFDLKSDRFNTAAPLRTYVQTATPTQNGWLVGFEAGSAGGDLQYYDNASGEGISLIENSDLANVHAILPIIPQALGQYASEFWVIISDHNSDGRGAIYRLFENGNRFHLTRHLQLPHPRTQIMQQANGNVFLSFYNDSDKHYIPHPPLILSTNGHLRRACETQANKILKALP